MKKNIKFLLLSIIVLFFINSKAFSIESFFEEGLKLFNNKEIKKSKFYFQKDMVFNPKFSKNYLYLAKIYLKEKNDDEQEKNLNTVLILEPSNEEAIYMMFNLMLKKSNFSESKMLIEKFEIACSITCEKKAEMKKRLLINEDSKKQ